MLKPDFELHINPNNGEVEPSFVNPLTGETEFLSRDANQKCVDLEIVDRLTGLYAELTGQGNYRDAQTVTTIINKAHQFWAKH